MIKDALATIDNHSLMNFEAGKVYSVRETVGCRLIARGEAEEAQNPTKSFIWQLAQAALNARNAEIERKAGAI